MPTISRFDVLGTVSEKLKRRDTCAHTGRKVWNVDGHTGENGGMGANLSLRCDNCWMPLAYKREEWV